MINCPCGVQLDLSTHAGIAGHIKTCEDYKDNSLLHRALEQDELHIFTIEQLLLFKSDLLVWIESVDHHLTNKGHQVQLNKISLLKPYEALTIKPGRRQPPAHILQREKAALEAKKAQQQAYMSSLPEDKEDSEPQVTKKVKPSQKQQQTSYRPLISGPSTSDDQRSLDAPIKSYCQYCQNDGKQPGNLLSQNDCGHSMCQYCFVEVYRSNQQLSCAKSDCGKKLNAGFIEKAAIDYDTNLCLLCNKSYNCLQAAKKHIQLTHLRNQRSFICDQCDDTFSDYEDMRDHIEERHQNSSDQSPIKKPKHKSVLTIIDDDDSQDI